MWHGDQGPAPHVDVQTAFPNDLNLLCNSSFVHFVRLLEGKKHKRSALVTFDNGKKVQTVIKVLNLPMKLIIAN